MLRRAPFAVLAAALSFGVWAAAEFRIPAWQGALLLGVAVAGWMMARLVQAQAESRWLLVVMGMIGFGIARYATDILTDEVQMLARYHSQRVHLQGAIVAEPDVRPDRVQLSVRPEWIRLDSGSIITQTRGLILVRVPTTTLKYGDTVEVAGALGSPPRMATFDFRLYLTRRDIVAWIAQPESVRATGGWHGNPLLAALLHVRDRVRQAVCNACPPSSAVLTGILIGDENFIPADVAEDFRRTGTSHIVAISGFNVSMVIALVVALLSRVLNRRRVALVALPAVAVYVVFVGASASVVRAGVMAGIALIGMALYRQGFTLNTLCAAAALILAVEPQMLFDIGFQLSFTATLGLVLFADRFSEPSRQFWERRIAQPRLRKAVNLFADGALVTLAAQVTTLPLLMAYFGQVPLLSLIVNTLILPLQPLIMILGSVSAALAALFPMLSDLALFPVCRLMDLNILLIRWGSALSVMLPTYQVGPAAFSLYYLGLLGALWWLEQPLALRQWVVQRLRQHAQRWTTVAVAVFALVAGLAYWFQRPDGRLHITFSGASAFLSTPQGHQVLFVGGGPVLHVLQRAMPLWDSEIELLLLPSADDSMKRDALEVLRRYRVRRLVLPPDPPPSDDEALISETWRDEWEHALRTRVGVVERGSADADLSPDPTVTMNAVPRRPRGTTQALGLRVAAGEMRLEIAGDYAPIAFAAHVTDLFISPRAFAQLRASDVPVQRIIWADRGGAPPVLSAARRAVWLRQHAEVELIVGVEGRVQMRTR